MAVSVVEEPQRKSTPHPFCIFSIKEKKSLRKTNENEAFYRICSRRKATKLPLARRLGQQNLVHKILTQNSAYKGGVTANHLPDARFWPSSAGTAPETYNTTLWWDRL